jgi:hypothetical protein
MLDELYDELFFARKSDLVVLYLLAQVCRELVEVKDVVDGRELHAGKLFCANEVAYKTA